MDVNHKDCIAAALRSPGEVMRDLAARVRALRLARNITQQMLAERVDVAIGTVKRFEKTGEIQLRHLLRIALVLGCMEDFESLFFRPEKPDSLFRLDEPKIRKRARRK